MNIVHYKGVFARINWISLILFLFGFDFIFVLDSVLEVALSFLQFPLSTLDKAAVSLSVVCLSLCVLETTLALLSKRKLCRERIRKLSELWRLVADSRPFERIRNVFQLTKPFNFQRNHLKLIWNWQAGKYEAFKNDSQSNFYIYSYAKYQSI